MRKGILITFEGPEGSGKSTQSRMLYNFLRRKGYKVVHVREPGYTKLGEAIREILLNSKNINISPRAEAFLYVAARTELIFEKIIPALKNKKIVICDRFADATIVYQGYGLGLDKKVLYKLNDFATYCITPDITYVLDVVPSLGLMRSKKTKGFKDRIEKRPLSFHRKVREGYLDLARKNPKRIKILPVKKYDKQNMQELIRKATLGFIKNVA